MGTFIKVHDFIIKYVDKKPHCHCAVNYCLLYSDGLSPRLCCIRIHLSNFSTILVQSGVVVGTHEIIITVEPTLMSRMHPIIIMPVIGSVMFAVPYET